MTALSNVPLSHLITTKGWLTGKHGGAGTILAVHSNPSGITFEIFLEIEWDTGNKSFPRYPDECINIIVDESWLPLMNDEYIATQVALLDQHVNYLVRNTNIKRIVGNAQALQSCHE